MSGSLINSISAFIRRVVSHEKAKPFFTYPLFLYKVGVCRSRYKRHILRCRHALHEGRKLRVLFLVSNCSKWKAQSLYDRMAKDCRFDPVLAVTYCEDEINCSDLQLQYRIDADIQFYDGVGARWVMACDVKKRQVFPLSRFNPDIVFFPVPWGVYRCQSVYEVSKYALTCYIPYALECFDQANRSRRFDFNHLAFFQQLMWMTAVASESYARYLRQPHYEFERAGRVLGLGHTALDPYHILPIADKRYVIYAPHWSFPWNDMNPIMNHATFNWSGLPMLEYARKHTEFNWVFKPHPLLKNRLVENGFMTENEVYEYYRSWEQFAICSYDGGYSKYFKDSRLMITDCGSFLLEYMAVGNPLIRLEPENFNMDYSPVYTRLLKSFYTCRSLADLNRYLKLILEEAKDPQKEEREKASYEVGLLRINAAQNILNSLVETLK